MKVSYIILTRNRKGDLRENLLELQKQNYSDLEIIVADNGSNDGTQELVKKEFPKVCLVDLGYNSGVTKGRNAGIKAATGDILIFVDDDAVLRDREATNKVVTKFAANQKLAILGFREKNYFAPSEPIQWHFPGKKADEYGDREFSTCYYPGAGHAMRKSYLEKVGLYPDYFFYSTEELDLSYRILDAGYEIKYTPTVEVFHKISPQTRTSFRYYFDLRNQIWFAMRLLPWPTAIGHATYWLLKVTYLGFPGNLPKVAQSFYAAIKNREKALVDRKPLKPETLSLIKTLRKS